MMIILVVSKTIMSGLESFRVTQAMLKIEGHEVYRVYANSLKGLPGTSSSPSAVLRKALG